MIDFNKPLPFWYCLLMVVLASLIRVFIRGFDRRLQLSQTSRIIRIAGGGLWAAMILAGMVLQVVKALH